MQQRIVLPIRISRSFVQNHSEWIFVYGNDYYRRGALGQAWQFAGEPNAYSVPTCLKYCSNPAFFYDGEFNYFKTLIDEQIAQIPRDNRPILKVRKLGEGMSRMKELAPKCWKYLHEQLDLICTNYTIDYTTPFA